MSKNRKIKDSSPVVLPANRPNRMIAPSGGGRDNGREKSASSGSGGHGRGREIGGIVALGGGLFITLSMIALQVGHMFMGPFGHFVGSAAYGLAGIFSYALIGLMITAAVRSLLSKKPAMPLELGLGVTLGAISAATLLHLAASGYRVAGHGPGGLLGEHIGEIARALIGTAGTALIATFGLIVAVVIATPLRMRQLLQLVGHGLRAVGRGFVAAGAAIARFCGEVVRAILPEREHDEYDAPNDEDSDEELLEANEGEGYGRDPVFIARSDSHGTSVPGIAFVDDTERVEARDSHDQDEERITDAVPVAAKKKRSIGTTDLVSSLPPVSSLAAFGASNNAATTPVFAGEFNNEPLTSKKKRKDPAAMSLDANPSSDVGGLASPSSLAAAAAAAMATSTAAAKAALATGSVVAPIPTILPAAPKAMAVQMPLPAPLGAGLIVEPTFRNLDSATMAAKEKAAEADRKSFIKLGEGAYQLPSIQLLNYDDKSRSTLDEGAMLELSARLTQTLENYGIKGDVAAIRPGPVVTMYEFAPAAGTRVNKIVNLNDDLQLALESQCIRIVAPIPGKAAVGIEVPNKAREKVFLKEILADEMFRKGKAKLPMALGKNIEGAPAVVDLASMPHLLVAGTTGSGKSVAVNAMITSLLYHCSPDDVRMIMVDPKMLELSIYEGIPHLLLPVVTDPKKANLALRWAVDEMERRYDLLAQAGVRDISTYNDKIAKQRAQWEADKLRDAANAAARALEEDVAKAIEEDDVVGEEAASDDGDAILELSATAAKKRQTITEQTNKLPFIVVVIDEFADLMMCAPKEVETSVARIAQKARAAGIHLILATQRPSVDVITGLIKANFPSRIAFRVTSKIDSRTILDRSGAEALLGAGDMLFCDRGLEPQRFHGCYVDEDEIHRVVSFLKTQARPVYNMDILKPRDEDGGEGGDGAPAGMPGGKSADDMYDKAVYIVTTTGNASISWVQRQLRIGYNRAARIVEEMEKQGVVSGPDHTNKREVLAPRA